MSKTSDIKRLHFQLGQLHRKLRDSVLHQTKTMSFDAMSEVVAEHGGDVVFAIDKFAETPLLKFCEQELYPEFEFVLIAEGLPDKGIALFSKKSHANDVPFRIIIDPIDGTRPLMYDKRSAWILTGVAHNRGEETCLCDIFFAIQTEIPTSKQTFSDTLWAFRDHPAEAMRENLTTGESSQYNPTPSQADRLDQGFASFVHFFHGSKEAISRIDETLRQKLYGAIQAGKAWTFEDQYMSTGGQIYELATGRDRFIADLRAWIMSKLQAKENTGLCCHPYDICTELIARSAGAIITNAEGTPLDDPLDVTTNVNWIGYANEAIKKHVEAPLLAILQDMGI